MKIYDDLKWSGNIRVDNGVIREIILHHRAGNGDVESIDAYHKSIGWEGIGYHYYIRKNGDIFSGRPELMAGAHTKGHNIGTLGICFEGNFQIESMNQVQEDAGIDLIVSILKKYPMIEKISKHNDYNSTACPGKYFPYQDILDYVSYMLDMLDKEDSIMSNNACYVPNVPSAWAKTEAAWATEKKLIIGDENGDIYWQKPVTKEELAIILKRALDK